MPARPTPADARILLSPDEAGLLLGISGKSVRRLVSTGKLPGSYLPLPGGSELLKLHRRHVERYAERIADEAERSLDLPDLRDWRRGSGRAAAKDKTGRVSGSGRSQ